jgi:PAS domain S-box-containing protein
LDVAFSARVEYFGAEIFGRTLTAPAAWVDEVPAESTGERIGTSDEQPVEGALSARRTRPRAVRYGAAVAAVALTLLLQALLIPLFGVGPNASPFMAFFAAVIVAAWFGGLGPGLLATALSALLSWYFFLSPQYSFEIESYGQGLRVVVFALEGAVISLLVGAMHSARREAEANALEIRRSEQEIRARAYQQETIAQLGQRALASADLQNLMQDTVESVAGVLEVEYSKVLELLPGGERLLLRAGVGWEEGLIGQATVGSGGDSQVGYTLLSDEPVIVEDLRSETRFSGPPLLHEHEVVSGMSVTISPGGRPFGVLGAHTRERREFTDDDVNFLRAVANVLAAAIERERAEERQRFLAETGELLSSSLDYRATLASVARLAVPTLADWCAVDVFEEDGSVERLAVEHEDPQKISLALKMQERYPPDPEAPSGVHNVFRTGRPEFYPEITDEMLEAVARDEEHLRLLRQIGFTSVIIVPMVARGRTLGALILVSAQSGRRFEEADLILAEELGRRAGLALDNARLYEEAQKEIAEREWAQAELRSSRDELEVILGGVADGVTAQDPTGRVIYANETVARMVGYPSGRAFVEAPLQEVMERFEVFDEEGRPFPLENLPGRRALGGEDGAEELLRFRIVETGEERWSLVRAVPVFDERKRVRMAVNIFHDITERKRSEDALREMREAERHRLARDLHDGVLQDLSYIAAAMGLIMLEVEGTSQEGELRRASDAARRAAQGLRDVVNDLRLEEERDRPLPELVESLVHRNRGMARSCEISLEVEEGFPSPPLGVVGTEMLRIIQEALTNARRHSGARNVIVSLRVEEGELVAEVTDNGQGFGAGTMPGVGLESMRERAAALRGELQIDSEVGEGTRVRLRVSVPQKG